MKSKETAYIELRVNTDLKEINIDKVVNSVADLESVVHTVGNEMSSIFRSIHGGVTGLVTSVERVIEPMTKISESLMTIAGTKSDDLLTGLINLNSVLCKIFDQMEEQQLQDLWTSIFSAGVDVAQLGWDIHSETSKNKTKLKAKRKGTTKVKVRKKGANSKSASNQSSVSGITAGGIGTVAGLDILEGFTLGGMGLMDGSLSSAFSDIAAKLKESAAATWLQNAATTAWQGISTAATAVTTAFGAAMNFLTSPIGLVVIGIAALIAIIALLIANWDTVKAAVLTAWGAVTGALATAAEWVDANVLQPLVGFFAAAMDWISTKVAEGITFVKGIFAGVNEFLQGVFAKDWTEQFGAFGNVLNAFFANVENIWSAIKSIFSGIVSFVKNVFAGDWGAAWNSIVDVFKGIWDYLVSVVKAPINGIIGLINGMVQGIVDGVNLVIGVLNGMSFDIPDWVPVIGGETFGFNLVPLKAPQIPYLAKGAVLPANKPFLAVVGDQKHGTNVEAPLATIQEAVALVMEDQFAGMMAGFEAIVGEVRALRGSVDRIEVGDTTIGQAAARYNRKMAIIKGGL